MYSGVVSAAGCRKGDSGKGVARGVKSLAAALPSGLRGAYKQPISLSSTSHASSTGAANLLRDDYMTMWREYGMCQDCR